MAGIPADWAGGREFLADPARAGTAHALGDMAAINLQLLHLLGPVMGDGLAGERDRLAGALRNALTAAEAFKVRENSTRELQPMNTIPVADYGPTANLAGIRLNQVPQFSGSTNDPKEVVRWISRVLRTADAHTLTLAATINLMVHASTGPASDFIDQMREQGKTIGDIIRNLELRYGDLCLPEEALTKVNTMPRYEGEGLSTFLDRVRFMARMAKRNIANANDRNAAIETLVENNIRRALPKSVRAALEERILTRTRMGLPAFTAMEIEKECVELEQRRNERKAEATRAQKNSNRHRNIDAVQSASIRSLQAALQAIGVDSPSDSSEEEIPDEGAVALINEIKQMKARYAARGAAPDNHKIYRRAIRRFNEKTKPKQVVAAVTSGSGAPTSGPPNRLPDSPRKPIQELLALANCTRGDCLHCGVTGHMMNHDACPLRGKPLVDKACMRCKKGLHPVDDCLTVFQQPGKAVVAQVQEFQSDSDLNTE